MQVRCQNCGEELIGAVNRCWHCGTAIAVMNPQAVPPIRRAPVDLQRPPSSWAIAPPWFRLVIQDRTRNACAYATIWTGGAACLVGLVSVWSAVLAAIGIVMGTLGMKTPRRDLAMTGLVLSVLALFLGFAQFAYTLWTKYRSQQLIDGILEQPF